MDNLKRGSECLDQINDSFAERTGQLELMSFWESEGMPGFGVTLHISKSDLTK